MKTLFEYILIAAIVSIVPLVYALWLVTHWLVSR